MLTSDAYLRLLEENDVCQRYADGLNDPEINRFLVAPRKHHQTIELVKDFVRMNHAAEDALFFGLFVGEKLRGTLRLHDAPPENVYLGLVIFDKTVCGQGWGRQMVQAAVDFSFVMLGVGRVTAGIEVLNVSSCRTFEAAGFVENIALRRQGEACEVQVWECIR